MTRADAIDWIRRLIATMKEETSGDFPEPKYKDEVYEALNMAIKALEKEKADETTDHPEWIDYQDGQWIYAKCPVCESVRNMKTPYCPICGTKMKGVIGK